MSAPVTSTRSPNSASILVWLTAVWTTGSGSRRLWRASTRCANDAPNSCPTGRTTTSSARRTRSVPTSRPTASGGVAGSRQAAPATRRGRARAHPRLRPEPRLLGAPLGPPPSRLVRPRRPVATGRGSGRILRGPIGRAPLDRPRPRSALPAVARHRPARLPPPGRAQGDDPGAQGGGHPLRRRGLLRGDARPRRRLPRDLGRTIGDAIGGRGRLAVRGVLVARHQRGPRGLPEVHAHRRGVLGPRMAAPAARLRLHLGQAAGRSPGRGRRGLGRGAPAGRRCLPASFGPPAGGAERAADRRAADPRAGPRGGPRRSDGARDAAGPGRTARRRPVGRPDPVPA